jgi:hypothetical protein
MERSYRNRAHGYYDDDDTDWGISQALDPRQVA